MQRRLDETEPGSSRRQGGRAGAARPGRPRDAPPTRSSADAPRHRREASRQPRRAAARRRRPDPRAPGLRLHRRRRARSGSRRSLDELRRSMLDRMSQGLADAVKSMTPGGPRAAARDGPRPQPAARAAGAGRRAVAARRRRVPGQPWRVLPRRADARRRHRPARRPDGGDAVAHALALARAAGRAPGHARRAAARRPAQVGSRPARREPGPAAARRAGGAGPVQRRRAAGRSTRRSTSSAASRRSTGSRRRSTARAGRATSARSTARTSQTCWARTPPGTSMRSRTSRTGSSVAGYLERDGDRLELTPRGHRRIGQKVLDELFARLHRDAFGGAPARRRRPRRRARRDVQAVRVRRPVPPRPPGHARQRAAARGERAGPARRRDRRPAPPRRLRGLPHRAHDLGVDRAAHRHEPLDAAAQLLPRRQEGRDRARHAHPDRSTRATTSRSWGSRTTPASSGRRRSPSCRGTPTSTARTSSTACCSLAGSSPASGRRTRRSS